MKKSFRKLIPSILMVIIAASLMGTSTFAWFSMNTNVTATGMQVTAKAEGGIVISNSAKADWSASATATSTSATIYPTSTADFTTWYHNKSTQQNNAMASQEDATYETLSLNLSQSTYGIGYKEMGGNSSYDIGTDYAYYLLNTFTIKSSAETLNDVVLYINSVNVTGFSTTPELDAALRVGVKVGSQNFIYAPLAGATTVYKVGGSSQSNISGLKTTEKNVATSTTTINNTTGVAVSIYIWFEGEDANCKSSNITGLTPDPLNVEVIFGTSQLTAYTVTLSAGESGVTLGNTTTAYTLADGSVKFAGLTGFDTENYNYSVDHGEIDTAKGTVTLTSVTGATTITISKAAKV